MRMPIEEQVRMVVDELAAEVRVPPSVAPAAIRRGRRLRRRRHALTGVSALVLVAVGLASFVAVRPGQQYGSPVAAASVPVLDPAATPARIAVPGTQVRIVDPPPGDRSEQEGADRTVDGDRATGWSTNAYTTRDFGRLKPGMGILVDLGEWFPVQAVQVDVSVPGAVLEIRTGSSDPGDDAAGDAKILSSFARLPGGKPVRMAAARQLFTGFDPDRGYRYLLVWITELPLTADSTRHQITVEEIEVLAP